MLKDILFTFLISFSPFGEARVGIPYAIEHTDLTLIWVFLIALSANLLVFPLFYRVIEFFNNHFLKSKWYRKAAHQGLAHAQYNLGIMYDNGEGVPENDSEAVKWWRKAADQGDADAQYNLGIMYDKGLGVPENNIRAYVWWSMAKTQGHVKAANKIDILKPQMTPQQIADGQAIVTKCYGSDYKDCD